MLSEHNGQKLEDDIPFNMVHYDALGHPYASLQSRNICGCLRLPDHSTLCVFDSRSGSNSILFSYFLHLSARLRLPLVQYVQLPP